MALIGVATYDSPDEMRAAYSRARARLWSPPAAAPAAEPAPSAPQHAASQVLDGSSIVWRGGREWLLIASREDGEPVETASAMSKVEIAAIEMHAPFWLRSPDGRLPRDAKDIVHAICRRHNLTRAELMSERRFKHITMARQEAYWWLSKLTGWSLPRIGRLMGGFDHTTILHGVRKHQARIDAGEVS
ncbi:hypothetical protein GCM10008171_32730 [Methylopila jiangsuensis]|uniref:Chromosomal replication initiator DnaA C-terminal domain-containing protein n=1 Tax=Methylopila jiangsuensis TaxID=586230 RepID=A0A9W6JLQ7_9HYPH|nr:helix-turn-helix domain-containing protein [Methylopila jiangsuensis]MDR6284592.1 hypothetical protein [Methylopila jiangsuensis]GLK78019.1 hypothetical protein GCM10008171_32730 [Methylopila jiangsuensis]